MNEDWQWHCVCNFVQHFEMVFIFKNFNTFVQQKSWLLWKRVLRIVMLSFWVFLF